MKFKLVESIDTRLDKKPHITKKLYYHGNNDVYEPADLITKKYVLDPSIKATYDRYIDPINSDECVYLLDKFSEEYFDNYDHYYIVECVDNPKECFMDYSPFLCNLDLKLFVEKSTLDKETLIDLCAQAYVGKLSRGELEEFSRMIGYSSASLSKEWISNTVRVVKKLK
jgi:hypothetical protein